MNQGRCIFFLVFLLFSTLLVRVEAQVTITPFGLGCRIDEPSDRAIILTNNGEQDVSFATRARLHPEEGLRDGPQRDDPGELLAQFRPPGGAVQHYTTGLAWDEENQWMWNNDFHSGQCWALDPADNFQPARQFNVEARCETMTLLNGHLYMIVDPRNYLTHYNRDGEHLNNVQFNFTTFAVASSQELGLLFVMGNDNVIHVYTVRDDGQVNQEVGRIANWQQFIAARPCRSMLWVDDHPDGQLWFNTTQGPNGEGGNWAWQVAVDTDEWTCTERVQAFQTRAGNSPQHWDGLGHDGENLWASFWAIAEIYIIDDGVSELRLVTIDPPEGVVEAQSDEEVFVVCDPTGVEEGVYNFDLEFTFNEEEAALISALVSVNTEVGNLFGVVTRADNNQPIANAAVSLSGFSMARLTDNQGQFEFLELPLGDYELSFASPGYLPQTQQVELNEEGDVDASVGLLHGECEISIDDVTAEMQPDNQQQTDFTVTNAGDGPLTYSTEPRLLGDANADPWTLRRSISVGNDREDSAIQGVIYVNGSYFVSGSGEDAPMIYAFNDQGEFQWAIEQPRVEGDSRGMRDLAWDGNLLWGCVGLRANQVFGMRLDGEVVHQFAGPYQPTTGIAWDSDHNVLWLATTTNNPAPYTVDGERADLPFVPRGNLRIYGLAYWPADPDGFCLYILHKEQNTNRQALNKADVETGEVRFVTYLDPEAGGAPEGAFITGEFDVYSWVMMSIANNPPAIGGDRIDVWQVDARKDWMQLEPNAGVIPAGEMEDFTLTLNTDGLAQAEYEAEIAFIHDGFDGEAVLPIFLNVVIGQVEVERELVFNNGWNMVSLNCDPDNPDIIEMFAPLVDNGVLLLLKDGLGHFYNPEFGFNNIPGWHVWEGYQARVSEPASLNVTGLSMLADTPLPLIRGWQIVAYYPQIEVDAVVAFSNIIDILEIAKDEGGQFYMPAWEFSNMPPLRPGKGYQIKVTQEGELVWALGDDRQAAIRWNQASQDNPTSQKILSSTSENMSVLILTDPSLTGKVEIYSGSNLAGAGTLANGAAGIAVWGGADRAAIGEKLSCRLVTSEGSQALELKTLQGEGRYSADGVWVAEVRAVEPIPTEFGILSAYPNPFNSITRLEWTLSEAGLIDLAIFDLEGRQVQIAASGEFRAGHHSTVIDGGKLSTGVYIVRLDAAGRCSQFKLTVLK